MKTLFVDHQINYDGSELKPLYAYLHHGLHGDSIVSFVGACDVSLKNMVDAEDFVASAKIQSDQMLHFIVEIFAQNLMTAVTLQRLLVSMAQNLLNKNLVRKGDDLYLNQRKLSVSIASASVVSAMIHLGLNVTNEGTPVPTCCLNDLGINPKKFADDLMKEFSEEYKSIVEATQKVQPL